MEFPLWFAYHEAGHAVIAHALGHRVQSVDIQRDIQMGSGGCCTHLAARSEYRAFIEQPDGSFRENTRGKRLAILSAARKDATISWAGCEAVSVLSVVAEIPLEARDAAWMGEHDSKRLSSISQEMFGKSNARWLAQRGIEAHRLVMKHWDAIDRLARALLERESLTGVEVVAIIGRPGRPGRSGTAKTEERN